jgi:hypothetical protein
MNDAQENEKETTEFPVIELMAKFLETVPPGDFRRLPKRLFLDDGHGRTILKWPASEFYCHKCDGIRYADPDRSTISFGHETDVERNEFCNYHCRNCRTFLKRFAIAVYSPPADAEGMGSIVKLGEMPLFGPHVPANVSELLGKDIEQFRKGLRAESQGLGIAAAAYYRRVVENQRTHLFDQTILAAESVNADVKMIERLRYLRDHWRFQQSIDEIKDCIPQILLIEGQNPLELLHPVLSDSIHDRTDDEALEIASEIRLVLINLAERIALAKTQSNELKQAVAKLAARRAQRKK